MGNYSKLVGAILGAVLARAILRWTGLDLTALGVGAEFGELVNLLTELGMTAASAAISGFVVYWFPANKPKVKDEPPTGIGA